jgi:LPXTG-motif cell wall-anchored protein
MLVVLVAAPSGDPTVPAGTGSGVLAATGTSAGPLLALAGVLAAAGAALVAITGGRRRAGRRRVG